MPENHLLFNELNKMTVNELNLLLTEWEKKLLESQLCVSKIKEAIKQSQK